MEWLVHFCAVSVLDHLLRPKAFGRRRPNASASTSALSSDVAVAASAAIAINGSSINTVAATTAIRSLRASVPCAVREYQREHLLKGRHLYSSILDSSCSPRTEGISRWCGACVNASTWNADFCDTQRGNQRKNDRPA